jgi:anti-sigma factor RsiW
MLTCRQAIALLDRYLTAEMNRDESARFERHLAACRDCVAFLQTYTTTLALTKDFLASQPVAIPVAPHEA